MTKTQYNAFSLKKLLVEIQKEIHHNPLVLLTYTGFMKKQLQSPLFVCFL